MVKLASMSHDIFQFFVYDEEKEKRKLHWLMFSKCHCSLKPENLEEF